MIHPADLGGRSPVGGGRSKKSSWSAMTEDMFGRLHHNDE